MADQVQNPRHDKTIAVMATLGTKGIEAQWVADQIRGLGEPVRESGKTTIPTT